MAPFLNLWASCSHTTLCIGPGWVQPFNGSLVTSGPQTRNLGPLSTYCAIFYIHTMLQGNTGILTVNGKLKEVQVTKEEDKVTRASARMLPGTGRERRA